MPVWQQQLREEISLAQVIPEWGLRHHLPPYPLIGPCFQCNQSGHLAKACPSPQSPTKVCPTLGQWGCWKMDCPQGCPGTSGEFPTSQTWRVERPQGRPGTSEEILTSPQNSIPALWELFQWWGWGSSLPAHVPNTSSELRVDGVVLEKALFYSRHWSHFLSFNFLLWPNSRLRTHNQGGLWSFNSG